MDEDSDADRLAAQAYARGEPSGWFEPLYAAAAQGAAVVPWDRGTPSPQVVEALAGRASLGRRAVVVGCGLGRDSEYVASLGYRTTGFDLSETAVRSTRERHPGSRVQYESADLLVLPPHLIGAFDLVVESYTVQSLPDPPRAAAIVAVRTLLAPGGTMLVVAAARGDDEPADGPPFPLVRGEIEAFAGGDVHRESIEHRVEDGVARWIAEFRRAGAS